MVSERLVVFDAKAQLVVEVALLGLVQGEDETAHRLERIHAFGPLGQRFRKCLPHGREVAEEDVFLAREVGEDRSRRDVGCLRDVGKCRGVVAALGEKLVRGAGDRLARPLLLALA